MIEFIVEDAEQTQKLGQSLAKKLRKNDLVMLSGELGAGKTTFTKGIGKGLKVRGEVSSPTFIVARVHPSIESDIDLIHVDAYRITSIDDIETLDLDSSMQDSVTVVEWGEGKVEGLTQSRLQIQILRQIGQAHYSNDQQTTDLSYIDDGKRKIIISPIGDRWSSEDFTDLI